jgi:DNA-binding GntR family transcriptional regulator
MTDTAQVSAPQRSARSKPPAKRSPARDRRRAEAPARGQLEYACQHLRDAIANGVYMPHQRLIEAEVTQALGVSRATLRAALIRLQQEGLVEIEVNRGARVRAFSLEDAVAVLLVREVLEGLAAVLAADRATPDDFRALRGVVAEMKEALAVDDVRRYGALNGRFHKIILDAAGNEIVQRFLGSLQYPLIRYQFGSILVPGRKDASLAEHQEILAALESRDKETLERVARRHVALVREAVQRSGGPLT